MARELSRQELEQEVAPRNEVVAFAQMIERAAVNPNVDVDKLERLMAMQVQIMDRSAKMAFNVAMSDCQAELRPVSADAANPQTKSKYASYATLDRAVRPIYTNRGFYLSFDTADSPKPDHMRVLCCVGHREGYDHTYHIDVDVSGKGAKGGEVMTKIHATGSAVTYGKRYLLGMIFNIAIGDDDDGNAAGPGHSHAINAEQLSKLRHKLIEVGADVPKFLAFMHVEREDQITTTQFPHAMRLLEQKKGAKQ